MRVLVVVPTTGGPAILRRLRPRQGLPVSAAFVDGDYRPLPWSADYARLAGAGGPIARALKRDALPPHELRLDRSFDAGRSWEAPIAVAHLMLARGDVELTDDPGVADLVVWTTGAVDLDLALIPGDYAVADKLERSRALFDAAGDATILIATPPGTPPGALAGLTDRPGLRAVEAMSAGQVAAAALGAEPAAAAPMAEAATLAEPKPRRTGLLAAAAVAVVALVAAGAFVAPSLVGSTVAPHPGPTPDPKPAPVEIAQPPKAPDVLVTEIRAPAGATCAQVLFGSATPVRRPVAADGEGAFSPSTLDASLCGIVVAPADPSSATVRISGGLAAASAPPRPEPGGGALYMLKAGASQKVVYEAQAVAKTGGAPLGLMRHELKP